jgi:hypothetical protein
VLASIPHFHSKTSNEYISVRGSRPPKLLFGSADLVSIVREFGGLLLMVILVPDEWEG